MDEAGKHKLRFHSESPGIEDGTLMVTSVRGREEISRPYHFELELVSTREQIDHRDLLRNRAAVDIVGWFRSASSSQDWVQKAVRWWGVLSTFQQMEQTPGYARYRAVLVPRFRKLALNHTSRIFQEQSTMDIVGAVLKEHGFSSEEFRDRTSGRRPVREYVAQYEESDLDFLHRWLEHEGIFYFFEQGDDGEKIVFADSTGAYGPVREPSELKYNPQYATEQETGLMPIKQDPVVGAFTCTWNELPKKVVLKDYNWRKPDLDLAVEREVSREGFGTVYRYNNHYKDWEEGKALAEIRAEEILCRAEIFTGVSNSATLQSGKTFRLEEHFRRGFNGEYLITEIRHDASQEISPHLGMETGAGRLAYQNQFTAMPSGVVFRPRRETPWASVPGVMHAKVDAAGNGKYAEISREGRYKIKLPLDLSGRDKGRASKYVRMAQPYTGEEFGMHFPLHKKAEVLLAFVDGNPDRPIISGSVNNPETPSVVYDENQTAAGFRTAGGNHMEMIDEEGRKGILIQSGDKGSQLAMGGSQGRAELSGNWTSIGGTARSQFFAGATADIASGGSVNLTAGGMMGGTISDILKRFPAQLAVPAGVFKEEWPVPALFPFLEKRKDVSDSLSGAMRESIGKTVQDSGLKDDGDFLRAGEPHAGLERYSAYLARGKGISRFKLQGKDADLPSKLAKLLNNGDENVEVDSTERDDVFIGTAEGDVDVYAGRSVTLLAKQKAQMDAGTGRLRLGAEPGEAVLLEHASFRSAGKPASRLKLTDQSAVLCHEPSSGPKRDKKADSTLELKAETALEADRQITIKGADSTITVKSGDVQIKTVGGSSILISPSGEIKIEAKGQMNISAAAPMKLSGPMITLDAQGMLELKSGGIISLNPTAKMINCNGAILNSVQMIL